MRLRVWLCPLFVVCVLANEDDLQKRRTKLPYVADALGNTLPPPSSGPATVGSPSNLLTPDRYEFYTFDESGELVKRLMTLDEIQAIVAAGEGTDGHLVTFANDDQPTIAFNFSQPPFTKVHSVVTNVQNVLKAQMEEQKNNPPSHAAFDTPDVSDSWSLILPSIFGNTGVDIVPDKSSNSFSTPETETLEIDSPISNEMNDALSKEDLSDELSSQIKEENLSKEDINNILYNEPTMASVTNIVTEQIKQTAQDTTTTSSTTTTTVHTTPTTTSTTTTSTTIPPKTTNKPRVTTKHVIRSTTVTPKVTLKYFSTTQKPSSTLSSEKQNNINIIKYDNSTKHRPLVTTDRTATMNFEKISILTTPAANPIKGSDITTKYVTMKPIPISKTTPATTANVKYIMTTPVITTTVKELIKIQHPITTYKPLQHTQSLFFDENEKESNTTTLTTQSVSPSTTVSTTEFMSADHVNLLNVSSNDEVNNTKVSLPDLPLFDVAQSISQIASDLGNDFPNPTTSNLLETMKENSLDIENKENLEIDIPDDHKNKTIIEITKDKNDSTQEKENSFIKISTIDPSVQSSDSTIFLTTENNVINKLSESGNVILDSKPTTIGTTIDPILSESMDDLLSQIVNQVPQSIIPSTEKSNDITTSTPKYEETTTKESTTTFTSQVQSSSEINKIINIKNKNDTNNENQKLSLEYSTIKNIPLHENITDDLTEVTEKYMKITTTPKINTLLSSTHQPDKIIFLNENSENKDKDKLTDIKEHKLNANNNNVNNDYLIKNKTDSNAINLNNDIKNQGSNYVTSTIKPVIHKELIRNESLIKVDDQSNDSKLNNIKVANTDTKQSSDNNKSNILTETITKQEFKKKIQKVNIDDKELTNNIRNNTWKLISTVSPPKVNEIIKDKTKITNTHYSIDGTEYQKEIILDVSKENQGLEVTTKDLGEDIFQFTELCNELAFRYWNTIASNVDKKRSFVLSPYSITSMLAMMFMGARGATSGEMNEILKLDDMVTFNPHFTLKNISDSIETTSKSGVAVSAFVRELYTDRNKGKILNFYKERAQQFYNGHVEEVNFKVINDLIRRRTNLLVKRLSYGKIGEYMKTNSINLQPPLAIFGANIFETDCSGSSVEGRDGEMYFVVSPNVRQRRLVPVPAVVYRKGFLAGYDPVLDATAAALGTTNSIVSILFLMPGQQGNVVRAEDLEALERRLLDSNPTTPSWNRLLRTLLPRMGLELQIPRFSHKSTFNISSTLKLMGLKDLFDPEHADLGGVNGPSKDLYLSDMIQTTTFVTCGEGIVGEQHHIEEYPETPDITRRRRTSRWATGWDEPRDYQRAFHDPHDVGDAMHLPLHLRPRQARLPARNSQPARLKFDRPFLYFVRHNPSGMILYVGRYNPRLLP